MYNEIKSRENIDAAFELMMCGLTRAKRKRFIHKREQIVNKAIEQLESKNWKIKYQPPFERKEGGKIRLIQPCNIVDKVIQRAMLLVLEPIFKKSMITECYQAIQGRGMHKGVRKIQSYIAEALKKNSRQRIHYLQIDIKKYYQSIDPVILKKILKHFIKDEDVLKLFDVILDGDENGYGKGVSIGDPISQWLGNLYLYRADHFFKKFKHEKVYYLRYADDMIFISKYQKRLRSIRNMVDTYFSVWYNLELKPHKFGRITTTNALDTLGYKFYIDRVAVRKHIKVKLSKALEKQNEQSAASYLGHCKWGNCLKMINNVTIRSMKRLREKNRANRIKNSGGKAPNKTPNPFSKKN